MHFHGIVDNSTSSESTLFNVSVDDDDDADDDGYTGQRGTAAQAVSFTRLITGLSAGEHTFKLRWRVTGGTGYIYAGAGTSGYDVHPQFWVREMS